MGFRHKSWAWTCAVLAAVTQMTACDSDTIVARNGPLIVVNTNELDFGPVPRGLIAERTINVLNAGDLGLDVDAPSTTHDDYLVPTEGFSLKGSEQHTLTVRFAPSDIGARAGTLTLVSNSENEPTAQVALTGEGTDPNVCGSCEMPPEPYCLDSDSLVVYHQMGTCVNDQCEYGATQYDCAVRCDPDEARCHDQPCVGGFCEPDAGMPDAGTPDGGTPDAGMDAGPIGQDDAGMPDAGTPDAGQPDAGMPDAGTPDAGQPDAGLSDPEDPCPLVDACPLDSLPPSPVSADETFETAGAHPYTVPAGVSTLALHAWGAGGASGNQQCATGGGGGYVHASVPVTPGEQLTVWVGETGRGAGGGGGASALLRGDDVLVIVGGGGGGASDGNGGRSGQGGAGGAAGAAGQNDAQPGQDLTSGTAPYCTSATAGTAGQQSMGGQGGTTGGSASLQCDGTAGRAHEGGISKGTHGSCDMSAAIPHTQAAYDWHGGQGQGNGGGGGGGSGHFGGGAGGLIWTYCGAGGGGGSSAVGAGVIVVASEPGAGRCPGGVQSGQGAGKGGTRQSIGTPTYTRWGHGAGQDGKVLIVLP